MFASITCPACQHKFSVPEGAMGKRQTCPNCHSPFVAGKSVAEPPPEPSKKLQPDAGAPMNKTMLGESDAPIRYNCPRCKKALEAAASEAGTKKPCPACGQRLQVPAAPAAPPPPAATPAVNKTMLCDTDAPPIRYNCPACKKPLESPANEAGTKKNCPFCNQRLQIPAASPAGAYPNPNKTMLASDESKSSPVAPGYPPMAATLPSDKAAPAKGSGMGVKLLLAGGVLGIMFILLFLTCGLVIFMSGPSAADREKLADAQKKHEQAVKDLADLRKSIEVKETMMREQRQQEEQQRKLADEQDRRYRENKDRMDKEWQVTLAQLKALNDEKRINEAKDAFEKKQKQLEDERKAEAERKAAADAKLQADLAATQKALADERARQATVVVSPPPAPVYYPYYHPRRYWDPYYGW
jgi:hypothetical protein